MNRFKERLLLLRPVTIPFILYIGILAFSANWIENNPESTAKVYIALLPLLPSIWIAVALAQYMKKLDELEQRIINEAAAFSFMITFLMILAFTFLSFAGIEMPNPTYLILFMGIFLAVGKLLGNRRYK